MTKSGKENNNPNESSNKLASFFGSSLFLNIQDNALKGQIQSYFSNPDSMNVISSMMKLEFNKTTNEKNDILSKYVNTEENKIDEHSHDKEFDLLDGNSSSNSPQKIPNERTTKSPRKISDGDDLRKHVILNQAKKNKEKQGEEENSKI